MRTDWMADAACAGSELDFYDYTNDLTLGEGTEGIDPEKLRALAKICCACPVKRACAEYAMRWDAPEQHGVWAGVHPAQRRDARKTPNPIDAVIKLAEGNRDAKRKPQQVSLLPTGTGRP